MPPVVKNLLIINVLVFLFQEFFLKSRPDLEEIYAMGLLWPIQSGLFKIWQPITHLFMHGNWTHIFFNMFTLWMFGRMLENLWGSKRFLQVYITSGLGAAAAHLLTSHDPALGASGAVMGLMAAFAYLFPNTEFYIYGLFPIRAKYLIGGLVLIDLFGGLTNPGDNIAHWAHLGGALTGFLMVFFWNRDKKNRNFY
jgi:membrane associated rhomboid family serine protease